MLTIDIGDNVIKEWLSYSYIMAVASRAGCQVTIWNADYDCIDISIKPMRSGNSGRRLPSIHLQAKACSDLKTLSDGLSHSFQLDRASYDRLRDKSDDPILLVVFDMPSDPDEWLTVSRDETVLRRAAFWTDMRNADPIATDSAAVRIPTENIFDHRAILTILERADARNRKGS